MNGSTDEGVVTPQAPTVRAGCTAVLLDRQPLWLSALASVLRRYEVSTVATAVSTTTALREVEELAPTAFVLDPWLEDEAFTGLDLIALLRERHPALRIVCLSTVDGPACVDAALAAGADVYVLKLADPEEVAQVIKHVASEYMFFAPPTAKPRALEPSGLPDGPRPELTRRELQILRIVAEGRSNGDIARRLWVTEQTVKFHLSNIYRKLGVSNRTEAGRWAHLHGLVPPQQRPQDAAERLADDLRRRAGNQA